jgi:hypothetical protein
MDLVNFFNMPIAIFLGFGNQLNFLADGLSYFGGSNCRWLAIW